ncbi:hypothetical protein ABIE89_007407 [Bradyrhizobium niftali]|uniref:hypothetical protein n=1 Tax=Bradyrhizobium niftali TaxID=2560055 RepID=UPI003832672D
MSALSVNFGTVSRPNRRLPRRILAILAEHDGMSAAELAASVYDARLVTRRGWHRTAPPSRLWATRRALRRLVGSGRVTVIGSYRRRRLFALADHPALPQLNLEATE